MSTRRKAAPPQPFVNPLMYMAAKQTLDTESVDTVAMQVLTAFDACKRTLADATLVNVVTAHLATAQALWAKTGNRPMYDRAIAAWELWCTACNRDPHKPFALTTKEYTAARIAIGYYLRALPQVELGRLVQARNVAEQFLESISGQKVAA